MAPRTPRTSRRDFIKTSAFLGSSLWVGGSAPARAAAGRRGSADDKLNIAVIGCGGKGYSDMKSVSGENIVALCDVDAQRAKQAFAENEAARKYQDFRVMLDREKNLDAVLIATPDHVHAVAAVAAMQRGLHVHCQKPLTHSVEEARVLRLLAEKHGLHTQMGNQGTSNSTFREAVEVIRSGAIGKVREVHVWTNRPIWPQNVQRPSEIQPIPATLRWDLWLGPAKHRPYNAAYAPFRWRGWWDFGTGALGDMACHIMNLPYLSLELGAPVHVEAESGPFNDESPPKWSVIRYRFPARGTRPAVDLTWYDGKDGNAPKQPPLDLIPAGRERKWSNGGSLMIGDRGVLYSPGDYGTRYELWPEKDFAGFEKPKPTLPRSKGNQLEWVAACKGGPRPMSNFSHAGPFTETVLLGNLAVRCKQRIEWDAVNLRATNCPEADRYIHDEYSYGYSIGI